MTAARAVLVALLLALASAPGAAATVAAPFLWELAAGSQRHYLLGSLHLLPPEAHPLPAALEAAYDASAGVVFESDLATLGAPETQLQMLAAARAGDAGLKALVPPTLYARLGQRAAELGMPMTMCEGFKPWFCALSLEVFNFQHAGFQPALGIDQHFYARALADDKPVRWLEDPPEHLRLFLDMPVALSEQLLAATVDELTEAGHAPADLLRIWQQNDRAALDQATRTFKARHPRAYDRMLAARNRLWVERIEAMLGDESSWLIVVGAAHLAGPDNLVDLLKARGHVLRPVAEASAPAP